MRSSIDVVPPLHKLDYFVDDQKNEEKERTHCCTILSASTIQRGPFDGRIVAQGRNGRYAYCPNCQFFGLNPLFTV